MMKTVLPAQRAQVQSLIQELTSPMPRWGGCKKINRQIRTLPHWEQKESKKGEVSTVGRDRTGPGSHVAHYLSIA